jgi:hypothetical protein
MGKWIVLVILGGCCGGPPAASPAPVARPMVRAPCFPDRPILVASHVFRDLEEYALEFGQVRPGHQHGRYGECTVDDGRVRTPGGVEVAELHCGIQVKAPGLVDHLGLQIGATAEEVLAGHPRAAERILCAEDGPGRTRCWFEEVDDLPDLTHYIVDGVIGGDNVSRGAPALAFFRTRRIVEMQVRMYCH